MNHPTAESYCRIIRRGDRLIVKGFDDECELTAFLSENGNATRWRKSSRGLAPGTYAYHEGKWTNVEDLDMSVLIHI
jgi:hypothetical protein